jgi:hypothetical protein
MQTREIIEKKLAALKVDRELPNTNKGYATIHAWEDALNWVITLMDGSATPAKPAKETKPDPTLFDHVVTKSDEAPTKSTVVKTKKALQNVQTLSADTFVISPVDS